MTQECVHYWILGDPAPVVSGTCKRCGVSRDFKGEAVVSYREYQNVQLPPKLMKPKTVDGDDELPAVRFL